MTHEAFHDSTFWLCCRAPVQPALSLSISHASFQAELEGAILQQTASVDFYLQTAAPKWSPDSYGQEGSPAGLRSLFLSDLQNGPWQPLAFSQVRDLFAAAADGHHYTPENCPLRRSFATHKCNCMHPPSL